MGEQTKRLLAENAWLKRENNELQARGSHPTRLPTGSVADSVSKIFEASNARIEDLAKANRDLQEKHAELLHSHNILAADNAALKKRKCDLRNEIVLLKAFIEDTTGVKHPRMLDHKEPDVRLVITGLLNEGCLLTECSLKADDTKDTLNPEVVLTARFKPTVLHGAKALGIKMDAAEDLPTMKDIMDSLAFKPQYGKHGSAKEDPEEPTGKPSNEKAKAAIEYLLRFKTEAGLLGLGMLTGSDIIAMSPEEREAIKQRIREAKERRKDHPSPAMGAFKVQGSNGDVIEPLVPGKGPGTMAETIARTARKPSGESLRPRRHGRATPKSTALHGVYDNTARCAGRDGNTG
jgi:hypothetical protein